MLLSLGGEEAKIRMLSAARLLYQMGFSLYATGQTSEFLLENKIPNRFVYKVHEKGNPNVKDLITSKKVSMVVNISDKKDLGVKELSKQITDGYIIRRAAVDCNIPLFTKVTIAKLFINSLAKYNLDMLKVKSWDEYVKRNQKLVLSGVEGSKMI